MREVVLRGPKARGRVALVDDADFEAVNAHHWWVHESGRCTYAITFVWQNNKAKGLQMHTLVSGLSFVDHKDHDGLNNQRSNLRGTTHTLNAANSRPMAGYTSRFKGVSWHAKSRRWQVQIRDAGRKVYVGTYTDEEDAARAYDVRALELWGEHALLNFNSPR